MDPFVDWTAEMVFSKLFEHFSKKQVVSTTESCGNSNSSSSSSSSSANVEDDVKNANSNNTDTNDSKDCTDVEADSGSGGITSAHMEDTNYEDALVQFQRQFERLFFKGVLYNDERKTWKHILKMDKKSSISQACSPMYLLRYIIYLVNRLGTGLVTAQSDEKAEEGENNRQERQTRKRAREEAIDNSKCVLKIQKVIDQCLVVLGKILDSSKRRHTNDT